jgi:uncharacterized repeat protein (TIGR01451 family)
VLGLSDLSVTGQAATNASDMPGTHQYFVPFDDVHLWELFEGKASCHGPGYRACLPLVSKIFVTAGADHTLYYYDHWEDGYDEDPLVPAASTEVGALYAGATVVFASDIWVQSLGGPVQGRYYYDGRDRITIRGEDANVVRLANASSFGRNGTCPGDDDSEGWLAAAWEVQEVDDWGTSYHATVGEDLDFSGGVPDDHDYAGVEIMAWQDGTAVYYDGVLAAVLDAGQTHPVLGANDGPGGAGVDSSDDITATAPIQVQMMTGACSAEIVSGHGYTLQPEDVWDNVYWAPVPGFLNTGDPVPRPHVDTDIYLHNPDIQFPLQVTVSSGNRTATVSIPPNRTVSVLHETGWPDLAHGHQGTAMSSSGAFWGVAVIDSATNRTGDSQDWDWGYSLVPESELSSQIVVGYAPGSSDLADNGNLAFVIAVTDTVIYVDLDQDGLPDPFDMDGDGVLGTDSAWGVPGWDERRSALGIPVQSRQILRVGDPFDRNLEGARIYTSGLTEHIAAAWGQDPSQADTLAYMDLGYTLLPLVVPCLSKLDALAVDADGSGDLTPGDTLTYTLLLGNNGLSTMHNVVLTDTLPYLYADLVGGVHTTTPPPVDTIEFYDGTNWRTTPSSDARMLRVTWPSLEPQQVVTVTFSARVHTSVPVTVTEVCNRGEAGSSNTRAVEAEVCTPVQRPLLAIDKAVIPARVSPGGRVTYTLVVTNYGDGAALSTVVSDVLAPWIAPVPGTLDLTWPVEQVEVETQTVTETYAFRGTYADDFDLDVAQTTNYTGTDGSLDWSTDWTEVNDDGDPGAGAVQVGLDGGALSEPAYLRVTDHGGGPTGVVRTLDLAQFISPALRYYVSGSAGLAANERYNVTVDGVPILSERYAGVYAIREIDLSAYAGRSQVVLGFQSTGDLDAGEFYRFDHISVREAHPDRIREQTISWRRTAVSYMTSWRGNPFSYDPATRHMVVTQGLHLPAGSILTATYQALVDLDVPVSGSRWLTNTACVASPNWLQVLSPPCDDAPVVVQESADLQIDKTDDPDLYVTPGGVLTYTLAYANLAGVEAQEVSITDVLPDEVAYGGVVEQPAGWSDPPAFYPGSPATLVWYTSTLPAGLSNRIVFTVTVNDGFAGTITNTVCISTETTEVRYDNNCADEQTDVVSSVADVAIVKSDDLDPGIPGGPLAYTLQYTNYGPLDAYEVYITDTFPVSVTYGGIAEQPAGWRGPIYSAGPPVQLTWYTPTLAVGVSGRIVYTVTADPDIAGEIENTVCITTTTPDADPTNNCDLEPTPVRLLYFRAKPQPGAVLLEWETAWEADLYGFSLLRSASGRLGDAAEIAFLPAAGRGHGGGARYAHWDRDLEPGGAYTYWLADVDTSGRRNVHQPLVVSDFPDSLYRIYLPLVRRQR